MALRPVDRLLLCYLGFVTVVILARGATVASGTAFLLVMHGLVAALILLSARHAPQATLTRFLHDFYPLILLLPFYAEFGVLNGQLGWDRVWPHDRIIQAWEAAIFGGQLSYEWIRRAPSVFWSGVFHLAYFAYYPIVILGPIVLALRGRRDAAHRVILVTMVAFVVCYVGFILFPVAGPYYAFPHPTGPVREVWSAKLVYGVLSQGSSFGAAFPSSHVAATVAATLGVWSEWRALGWSFVIPCALLTVGAVYGQMHYGVDSAGGLIVGVAAWLSAKRVNRGDRGDS